MRETWWNDNSIPIVEIEGRYICLAGWNGEAWLDCWETSDGFDVQSEGICVRPIYDSALLDFIGYELF